MAFTAMNAQELRRIASSLRVEISELEKRKSTENFEYAKMTSFDEDGLDRSIQEINDEEETSETSSWGIEICSFLSELDIYYVKKNPLVDDIYVLKAQGKSDQIKCTFEIHLREVRGEMEIVYLSCGFPSELHATELEEFIQECQESKNLSKLSLGMRSYFSVFSRRHMCCLKLVNKKQFIIKKKENEPGITIDVFGKEQNKILSVIWKIKWSCSIYHMLDEFIFVIDDEDSVFNTLVNSKMLHDFARLPLFSPENISEFWNTVIYITETPYDSSYSSSQ